MSDGMTEGGHVRLCGGAGWYARLPPVAAMLAMTACVGPPPAVAPGDASRDSAAPVVHIRLHNTTNVDLEVVTVRFINQTEHYGSIARGGFTDYRAVRGAYRYAQVEARRDGHRFLVQPLDYVGERPLSAGRYTYTLRGLFPAESAEDNGKAATHFMQITLQKQR